MRRRGWRLWSYSPCSAGLVSETHGTLKTHAACWIVCSMRTRVTRQPS